VTLINGCFRQPVFFVNCCYFSNRTNERLSEIEANGDKGNISSSRVRSGSGWVSSSGVHVTNPLLLTQVVLEWELWIPFEALAKNRVLDNSFLFHSFFCCC
jgi:hypothetical protein